MLFKSLEGRNRKSILPEKTHTNWDAFKRASKASLKQFLLVALLIYCIHGLLEESIITVLVSVIF